jgi:hypothetical protein
MLGQVTNLFLSGAERFSEQQVVLFDDVIESLIKHIEQEALAELSVQLAPAVKAPPRVIRKLAAHDAIEIAGPILTKSEHLTDQDLIEIAKTKGQAHQLKIAERSWVSEAVTDVLIDRGDSKVVHKVAGNSGARFSDVGFLKLAILADGDDHLTAAVACRSDVPPHVFREILTHASTAARNNLLAAAPPSRREHLNKVLSEISFKLRSNVTTKHYVKAQQLVRSFSQDTLLTKMKLSEFAQQGLVDETVATLAELTAVPIELVDRLFYGAQPYGFMAVCKLMTLDWRLVLAILQARPNPPGADAVDLEAMKDDYQAISAQVAQRLVRFWQSRQDAP